ncbi:Cof-type HAD-IIB family hydrolase [uncultured Eubacterium sp.]|uniref:Cof-type HAD-IIB family hydrolase n=1 Tax=uncultured Eubacterium sp. TaxID=165185 RepID=UPI0025E2A856|nr:Cof-type HAD-IIB family hydrolase [uncultured Eubacterium sp.]
MTEQFVKKHAELWKFIKFNISVLVTSAIDILSYLVLLYFVFKSCNGVELGDNALLSLLGIRYKGYLYSYLISTALGYISAYLINRRVTFHSDVNPLYSSVLYIVLAVFNILVSSYIGSVFGTYMSIHNMSNPITEIISKFVIINIPTLWTYPLERYVIQINKPKKKKVIRYIASDLDGTLISSDNEVSEENLDAIDRMHNAGVRFIVLTGRTLYEVPLELRHNDSIDYIIYSNGVGIWDRKRGLLKNNFIDDEKAKKVFEILSEYETFTEIYSGGRPYVDASKFDLEHLLYYKIDKGFIPEMNKSRVKIPSLRKIIDDSNDKVEMFDVFFRYEKERQECLKRLKNDFDDLFVTSSMSNNLEIVRAGNSKGNTLIEFCNKMGIDIKSVTVLGDSRNDISAFETDAKGYAVANACDELKNLADKVICSNDENVMRFMERETVYE